VVAPRLWTSMRKWSAWTDSIEREHLTEFGVNGIAVDYGHDFDTTTKASIVHVIQSALCTFVAYLVFLVSNMRSSRWRSVS
jgi:hypothetical protein